MNDKYILCSNGSTKVLALPPICKVEDDKEQFPQLFSWVLSLFSPAKVTTLRMEVWIV